MTKFGIIRRFSFLFRHPGFTAAPTTVIFRGIQLVFHLVFRRPLTFPISPGGEIIQVPARTRYTSTATFLFRDWCEPELRHLDKMLKPGDIFLDVGANIGIFSLRAANLVGPNGRVLAIEPGEEALKGLDANIALNPELAERITVIRAALSNRQGTANLYHTAGGHDPQAYSLIQNDADLAAESVATTTLDAVIKEHGLSKVDLIKLDVEGLEPLVIDGGAHAAGTLRPSWIIEMNSTILKGAEIDSDSAWDRLKGHGYAFSQMGDDGTLTPIASPPTTFCNVVARPSQPVR